MSGIIRRRAMMHGAALPYDAEVEWIKSTGTQFIDTGVPSTYDKTELDVEIAFHQTELGRFMATSYVLSDKNPRCYLLERTVNNAIRATNQTELTFASNKAITLSGYGNNTFYRIVSEINSSRITLQGSSLTNAVSGADGSKTYYLFCLNSGTGAMSFLQASVKKARIKVNDILVRDYIPVRIGTAGYLYDRGAGQMYGSLSGTPFIVGPDV